MHQTMTSVHVPILHVVLLVLTFYKLPNFLQLSFILCHINSPTCFQIQMFAPLQHTRTFLWWIYLGHRLMTRTDAQWRFKPVFLCVSVRVKALEWNHAFISHAVPRVCDS